MSTALLLTNDLLFGAKFQAAATRAGVDARVVMSTAAVLEQAAGVRLIMLDLTARGIEPAALVAQLRTIAPAACIGAYAPHVQTGMLAAARAGGCNPVLTRGQFDAGMDQLLREQCRSPGR